MLKEKDILRIYFVLILLSFNTSRILCQETKLSDILISVAEELSADESDPAAVSIYIERLRELADNPVKINSSGEDEISRLFFLSDFQIKALSDYAHSSGRIISVFEIANIPGFDKETTEMMIPFITLDNAFKLKSDPVKWRNTLITNLSDKPGEGDTTSYGSSLKILSKYKFAAGGFSGGITIEKDPGEKFLKGNPPLPDFLSANITYNGHGYLKRLIIGDFSARFGQGTNVNTGIRSGLSLTAPGYMAARNEIRPYTSADENNFFRGAAAELAIKDLAVAFYYSVNLLDATTGSLYGDSIDHIENFYKTGLHNTPALISKKDAISDLSYGLNISYNFEKVRIGMAWSEDRLSLPVIQSGSDPEAVFDFNGDRNSVFTLYYNSLINRIMLFGETSVNGYSGYAVVQGLSVRPSDRLTVNILFRKYGPEFTTLHGNGPGSSSSTSNEKGVLGNFTYEAAKHLFISGGIDLRDYGWLRYRNSAPTSGTKKEIRIRFLPSDKITAETVYDYRLSMFDEPASSGIPGQMEIITRSIKGSVKYSPSENLTFGTRVDYKCVYPSNSRGMLLLQDINYRFIKIPVTIWLRYCIFNTDDWDSRIYTYENDLLYSFSIPALSGEGSRSYIMVKWDINDVADIRLKYGITSIAGNNKSFVNKDEVKFQLKILF